MSQAVKLLTAHRVRLLRAALGFLSLEPREPELQLLHSCFDTWRGIGDVVAGMARQEYDLELRRYNVPSRSYPFPESSELGRNQLAVPDLAFQGADLAGEPADVSDHLLGNGRVVEGGITRHLVRDEARLLGGKQALCSLHGQLRVGAESTLGFHDGPHGPGSDIRMLLDESLRGHERREGPVAGGGRPVAPAHVEQDLGDASLHAQVRPQAVAPVAVRA